MPIIASAAGAVQPPLSNAIMFALLVIFGASLAIFLLHVRSWTTRRRWVSLSEWASERGMKVARRALTDIPAPIDQLRQFNEHPRARMRLDGGGKRLAGTTIMQFDTGGGGAVDEQFEIDFPAEHDHHHARPRAAWNVLIRRLPDGRSRVPAALRPGTAQASVIDFFPLTRFNSLSNDRFAVLAIDGRTANRLAKSSARALLPQDVGLLLYGEHLVLDFSARPFDPTELDRLLAVADQVGPIV
jgi:hypothetical protein